MAGSFKILTEFSLTKNLIPITDLLPRSIVTWDKFLRVQRHLDIWNTPNSIVHRLPKHYQDRFWHNLLIDRQPVHYYPQKHRFYWDKSRLIEIETEHYPILPEYCIEQDQGLWAGEGVIKGYRESRPYTKKKVLPRRWIPHLWFPVLKSVILYCEILDKHLQLTVTERAMRQIENNFGLDLYLLNTADPDINSRIGIEIKRHLLIKLSIKDYYLDDPEKHEYICQKYTKYVLPIEEAQWYGLDLNEACRKQQDLEDNLRPLPLKYVFEKELVDGLRKGEL